MPDHHQLYSFQITPLEATERPPPKVQPLAPVSGDHTSVCPPNDNSNG